MNSHGNPTVLLPFNDVTGRVVEISTIDDQEVWHSHPLVAGRSSICVDVRDGCFVGSAKGWSVLLPGTYIWKIVGRFAPVRGALECAGKEIKVTHTKKISSFFQRVSQNWFSKDVAWHSAGFWEYTCVNNNSGLVPALSEESCSYLFVDFAMHGVIKAKFTPPSMGSIASWGLIARHYNAKNHIRLTVQRKNLSYRIVLERFAEGADPKFDHAVLDENHVSADSVNSEICWIFNGQRHEIELDGRSVLTAKESYMGGVEIVGLFAERNKCGNPVCWNSFAAESSQWVAKHVVKRGEYSAVVRAGNIHQFHFPLVPGASASNFDSETNIFWESGLQLGHIGGSEIKFTQGSSLDMLAQGPVADWIRWRGPMPRFVDQDTDLRGYARGSATFYNNRIVVSDWVAVQVFRSVGPDFDLLGKALSSPALFATGREREFHPWKLLPDCIIRTVSSKDCDKLFPVALMFPVIINSIQWYLIAAVGGLQNVGEMTSGKIFGWQCSTGLTASHNLRVVPTTPGIEYGFWIAISWLQTNDIKVASTAALHLRDEFQKPATLTSIRGTLENSTPSCEQEVYRLALEGCFDRGMGFYRMQADRGALKFIFDPLDIPRHELSFMVNGLSKEGISCSIAGEKWEPGTEYTCQSWPTHTTKNAVLVQLLKTISERVTVEIVSLDPI